ncbi:unnamed protein product, partial [Chrysoparadoxa australica]
SKKPSLHLPELDLLRGYAALFMVVNHLGNSLFSHNSALGLGIQTLLFITSFAPVLFFFTSGLGMGLQSAGKQKKINFNSTLYKFALLIIADMFLAFGRGNLIGLDFLGFIAIIVLLLDLIRSSRHPILISIASIGAIFIMRFAIAPKVMIENDTFTNTFTNWFLGNGVNHVSYPFAPWFIYPLVGFLLGAIVGRQENVIQYINMKKNWLILAGFAALCGGIAYLGYKLGFSFFRWGTIGIGFFILSFTVIATSLLIVMLANKLPKVNMLKLFNLNGPACLAVVPIHYFFIHIMHDITANDLSNLTLIALFMGTVVVSFLLAKYVTQLFGKINALIRTHRALITVWVVIL